MSNIYKESIVNLLSRIPILRKEQLILYLVKIYDLPLDIAESLLEKATESGYVLISPNDLVTTRATMNLLYKKDDISIREHIFKLARPIVLTKDLEIQIDAFWVVLKNLPDADDFVFLNGPISAVYTDKSRNKIVEIVVIPHGKERLYTHLFKYHFTYSLESQKYYERIGIVNNARSALLMGNVGFTEFYYIDKTELSKNIIYFIGARDNNTAWEDVEYVKEKIEEDMLYEL